MSSVVFLCSRDELDKERRGYATAFERRMPVHFVPPQSREDWMGAVQALHPVVAINPDGRWWLPEGIERLAVPTAVFHIDTFVGTRRRVQSSVLYDYVFVFHPHFAARFSHPGLALLPHAADTSLLRDPRRPRTFEVASVGHSGRPIYRRRDAITQALNTRFLMNDPSRSYTWDEMADLYGNSRIVVNVSRDDWPQDANLRCFEAMAAGALLVTRVPSELSDLGFVEDVHFASWRDGEDVTAKVAGLLADDEKRLAIAARGHELVRSKHTYDVRVDSILSALQLGARAPARDWPQLRAWRRHFDLHVEYGDVGGSLHWLRRIGQSSVLAAISSTPKLVRLSAKALRSSISRHRKPHR